MSRRRVVVTGLGATTPIGGDVTTSWSALLAGTSGVRNLTEEWAQTLPVHFAARVAVEPSEQMERVELRRLDRSEQFSMIASRWRSMCLRSLNEISDKCLTGFKNPMLPKILSRFCQRNAFAFFQSCSVRGFGKNVSR